jgi:hypothetical protein
MNNFDLLKTANMTMAITFLFFLISAVLAYGYEQHFPIMILTLLHVSQLILAGIFKVSYVIRLVAQKQLGLVPS